MEPLHYLPILNATFNIAVLDAGVGAAAGLEVGELPVGGDQDRGAVSVLAGGGSFG